MITLTSPAQIQSILGGNAPIAYDKLVISPISFNPISQSVAANLVLTSTAKPAMPALSGNLSITLPGGAFTVQIPNLFSQSGTLTGPQVTSVQGWVDTAQANLENGLIGINLVAGTRTAGV